MNISKDNALAIIKLLGTSQVEIEQFLLEIESGEDLKVALDTALTYTPASIHTDWKYNPADLIQVFADRLRVRPDLSQFKINLEISTEYVAPVLNISLKINKRAARCYQYLHNHDAPNAINDLVFSLEKLLQDYLEIYALVGYQGSDATVHLIAATTVWQQVREVLAEQFEQLFIRFEIQQQFIIQTTRPAAKLDWQKLWQLYGYNNYSPPFDKSFPEELRRLRGDNLNFRSPTVKIFPLISQMIQQPLKSWYLDRDLTRLPTVLFTYATAARVGALWDILNYQCFPGKTVNGVLGYGMLIWAYFIYLAMGADDEADECGRLMMRETVIKFERKTLRNNQTAYYDLALFLHNGSCGSELNELAEMLPLLKREGWQKAELVLVALKLHFIKYGEQFAHESFRWTWPATLYALARRANAIELLPQDNPFLNAPLDLSMVDRDDQLLQGFLQMEQNYRDIDQTNLPPPIFLPKIVHITIESIETDFLGQPLMIGYTRHQTADGEWHDGYRIEANPPTDTNIVIGEVWRFRVEYSKPKQNYWVLGGKWCKRIKAMD